MYEWAPGGCFVLHTAHGRIGDLDGGAIEMIGHDEASGGDTWSYEGDVTRSTVEFSGGHRVQTVLHERTDDGTAYQPISRVTPIKVG